VQGITISGRSYAGGWWDWLAPFSDLTGVALVVGYSLLGACWLVWKTEGELQRRFHAIATRLAWVMLAVTGAVSLWMLILSAPFREHWLAMPGAAGAAPGRFRGEVVLCLFKAQSRRAAGFLRVGVFLAVLCRAPRQHVADDGATDH